MKKLLLLLPFFGLFGCSEQVRQSKSVFMAGEVVNPTDEVVVLLKGEQPLDTARLDGQNRFEFRLDSVEDGLYVFKHAPEHQYVFLEAGDSLQIRLNTIAFDESLVFSGKGEEINNFLVELFLQSEAEEGLIRNSYIRMEPDAFRDRMDSLKATKLQKLQSWGESVQISDKAFKAAKASILYHNYLHREMYPFWHRKLTGDMGLHKLPPDFYAYRQQVSYNDPDLTFLKPYHDFMIYHIGNLAYMGCRKKCETRKDQPGNRLHFDQHQLHLIDSLVTGAELRDNLFRRVAIEYLLKSDSDENFDQFMESFHQVAGNNRHLVEIDRLSKAIEDLRPERAVPDLVVESAAGDTLSLRNIASDGSVVFYFWSGPQQHHLANITRRVQSLQDKYQAHRFVGICLNTDRERWKSMLKTYQLKESDQFWTGDFENFAQTLVVFNTYKSILAEDGKIVDGFANLNTSFE